MKRVTFPAPLREGDRIAIVSPASSIDNRLVDEAIPVIMSQGWTPVVMPSALGSHGSYSATRRERLNDLTEALCDPTIRAVMCSRGGYGAVHLIDSLPADTVKADPKWLIGFSDISALHSFMSSLGIASLHASMCKHLAEFGADDPDNITLFNILRGSLPTYSIEARHDGNKPGTATGQLFGGNLAVLGALIGTPYDMFAHDDAILFLEDIAEPIYKVERQLYQLRLSGVLDRIKGLIVGQFTEYRPDRNYSDMLDMVRDMTADLNIPVAYNFPIGHIDHNLPVIESAPVMLDITPDKVNLSFNVH